MSQCFTFYFSEDNDSHRKNLVIFTESSVGADVVSKTLKREVEERLVPKSVFLISLSQKTLSNCKDDQSFSNDFLSYVGDIKDKLFCIKVSNEGEFTYESEGLVENPRKKSILQAGMLSLFEKHRGLIVSNTAYHFVKPSGAHCNKFIRTSNLLVSSCEVAFLVLPILKYFKPDIRRIYIDTSSIAFLLSIAVRIYDEFSFGNPSIESFESYSALDNSYDFVEDDNSLVFISATTSGSLAKKLIETKGFSPSQIITLLHKGALSSGQIGIFDISEAIGEEFVSKDPINCELCKTGSRPIYIAGEQFLLENPKHELLLIKKIDFSQTREDFFRQFALINALKCEEMTSFHSKEHFYIDIDEVLKNNIKPFSSKLEKLALRYLSQHLKLVVTLDDAGSQALCDKLKSFMRLKDDLVYKSFSELDEEHTKSIGSVLVVAGAITSGRTLLAISRKLRNIAQSASIVYFVGFSKLPSTAAEEQLRKDLRQGGHDFVIVSSCPLPRVKEYSKTAWDYERELLKNNSSENVFREELSVTLPSELEERYKELERDSSRDANNLFLWDSNHKPLKLRRTFAFWSGLDFTDEQLSNATQADVYWTIQSVLHDLRDKNDNSGLATPYHTTLISPANFDRYNDGIIQACILRAALPVELNYKVDFKYSRQMTDVIKSVLENWNNEQGEAALEFLLSICSKRLQLEDEHLKELVTYQPEADMSPEIKFMLKILKLNVNY